jgi:aspartate-semialdehyde dehydrogenase
LAKSYSKSAKIALLGSETLLGRELEEVLKDRSGAGIASYSATGEGNFGDQEGEAIFVQPFDDSAVREHPIIVLAGSAEGAAKAWHLARASGQRPLLIDCIGHLENEPEARIVAPLLQKSAPSQAKLLIIAHPAASALALVLSRLGRFRPVEQAVVSIFEPASEQGKRGIAELHQQTTSLLSFKPLDKQVFDAQLSFNLLPQFGEEAQANLGAIEHRIERHLATVLSRASNGSAIPMPSLRLIQVPVFHGYSISLWVRFQTEANAQELREALASAQIEVRGVDEEAPSSAGAVSQSGLIAGDIRIDRNERRAAWIWIVGDNLRLTADAAADLIAELGTDTQ